MGKHYTEVRIKNAEQLLKQLCSIPEQSEKAVNATVKDFKSRAPGWVSQAVREKYSIPAQEIKPLTKAGRAKGVKIAGHIGSDGDTLGTVKIVYTGRVLTPVHFGLSPKVPKEGAYTITVKIKNKKRKRLGGRKKLTAAQKKNIGRNFTKQGVRHTRKEPIMLIHTGNTKEGGTNFIPMRIKKNDKFQAIKTLSLPQMVEDAAVMATIDVRIEEEITKRLEHNLGRCLKIAK
ncbi:hypothetical protein LI177_05340 [bacterium 210820-DFI.6.37]|nr:hypothetical protein [bacterium 210820-DFI.6.37]